MTEISTTAAIILGLLLFGVAYNWIVGDLERRGRDRGFTALLVALGSAITIAGAAVLVGIQDALIVLVCFAASGTPMIVGSLIRYAHERELEERTARELVLQALQEGGDGDCA